MPRASTSVGRPSRAFLSAAMRASRSRARQPVASRRGVPVSSHGVHELHVHLLAAVRNPSYLEVHGFATERFVREPPRFDDGAMIPPARPGHGVELDWEALEPYRV